MLAFTKHCPKCCLFSTLQAPSEEHSGTIFNLQGAEVREISGMDLKSHREPDMALGCELFHSSRVESLYSDFFFTLRNYIPLGNSILKNTHALGRWGITELCWMSYNLLEKLTCLLLISSLYNFLI